MKERGSLKRYCLLIPKKLGERAIQVSRKLEIFDRQCRISRNKEEVLLPLLRDPTQEERQHLRDELGTFRITEEVFERDTKQRSTVRQILKETVPREFLERIPRSLPIVGDIAIIEIPNELADYDRQIGEAILVTNPSIKTVLKKTSRVHGTYRTRDFEAIAGEKKTVTVHREYRCILNLDLSQVYFNPRLSYERNRVSRLVGKREIILDMFAGVGPFSIQIASNNRTVKIFAVDINPIAIEYLNKNIEENRMKDQITAIEGDIENIVKDRFEDKFDRVVMNLPGSSERYLGTACKALKRGGGIIHYYQFARGSHAPKTAEKDFREGVEKAGRKVERITSTRRVAATAPREWQIGIDACID
jgi:tRNA (guanine37-N1)-methyltransferase